MYELDSVFQDYYFYSLTALLLLIFRFYIINKGLKNYIGSQRRVRLAKILFTVPSLVLFPLALITNSFLFSFLFFFISSFIDAIGWSQIAKGQYIDQEILSLWPGEEGANSSFTIRAHGDCTFKSYIIKFKDDDLVSVKITFDKSLNRSNGEGHIVRSIFPLRSTLVFAALEDNHGQYVCIDKKKYVRKNLSFKSYSFFILPFQLCTLRYNNTFKILLTSTTQVLNEMDLYDDIVFDLSR